jgi:DNA-binding GntR family transcriptional regulator
VDTAVREIRELILMRQLSPGEQMRQGELAAYLGVSRSPVREALKALHAEGFVTHSRNRGFFVVRLSADEMRQTYLMRRLLETEILRSLEWPTRSELAHLREINATVTRAAKSGTVDEMVLVNREFHFEIFVHSALQLVVAEVRELWLRTEPYRAVYMADAAARQRIIEEHGAMLEALRDKDATKLVEVADLHRAHSERWVVALLEGVMLRTSPLRSATGV